MTVNYKDFWISTVKILELITAHGERASEDSSKECCPNSSRSKMITPVCRAQHRNDKYGNKDSTGTDGEKKAKYQNCYVPGGRGGIGLRFHNLPNAITPQMIRLFAGQRIFFARSMFGQSIAQDASENSWKRADTKETLPLRKDLRKLKILVLQVYRGSWSPLVSCQNTCGSCDSDLHYLGTQFCGCGIQSKGNRVENGTSVAGGALYLDGMTTTTWDQRCPVRGDWVLKEKIKEQMVFYMQNNPILINFAAEYGWRGSQDREDSVNEQPDFYSCWLLEKLKEYTLESEYPPKENEKSRLEMEG
ncbi:hypothetical protein BDP27DRAFT_1488735 [Rhodocollybia butyracea]|uniref:Uncharacterized protein n=1 Tax=Rhodocollybia butyracea TaxID=206335 RepID=A0A9P5TZY4_9AGAR|nr:hypothetical protein BDP27DRAFT_1488735 [Rhodocollybia butyracea]